MVFKINYICNVIIVCVIKEFCELIKGNKEKVFKTY